MYTEHVWHLYLGSLVWPLKLSKVQRPASLLHQVITHLDLPQFQKTKLTFQQDPFRVIFYDTHLIHVVLRQAGTVQWVLEEFK